MLCTGLRPRPEGPGYWCFVTKYVIAVSECLTTAAGTDNGYMAMPGINATALFVRKITN